MKSVMYFNNCVKSIKVVLFTMMMKGNRTTNFAIKHYFDVILYFIDHFCIFYTTHVGTSNALIKQPVLPSNPAEETLIVPVPLLRPVLPLRVYVPGVTIRSLQKLAGLNAPAA